MAGVKRPKRLRRSRRIKRSRKVRRRSRSKKVGGVTVAAWPEVQGGARGPGSAAVAPEAEGYVPEVDAQGVFRPPPLSPLGKMRSQLDKIETNQTEIFRRLDAIDSVTHFSTKEAAIQFIPTPPGDIGDVDDLEGRLAALMNPQ